MLVIIVAKVSTVATNVTGAALRAWYQVMTYPASNPIDVKVISHWALFSLKINPSLPLAITAKSKISVTIIIDRSSAMPFWRRNAFIGMYSIYYFSAYVCGKTNVILGIPYCYIVNDPESTILLQDSGFQMIHF